jgi:hypothetical protein
VAQAFDPAGITTGLLTFPGTFLGGDLPTSTGDLATGMLQDAIQEEVRRELEAEQKDKHKKTEDSDDQTESPLPQLTPAQQRLCNEDPWCYQHWIPQQPQEECGAKGNCPLEVKK